MSPEFEKSIAHVPGLLAALTDSEPVTSIRLNPAKDAPIAFGDDRVPWCDHGFYLAERPKFTLDPAFHQGRYYVQDASSMFITHAVSHILDQRGHEPLRYLDACAAPGGKTTAAIDSLPAGSMVVANEYDPRRAQILAENVAKWGNPSTVVATGDTSRLSALTGHFDIIAVDAPCSGEGMMRKDAVAVEQWSPALVTQCAERQCEILENILPALAPGGYLIYSTCTFNPHENEEIVQWLLDRYPLTLVPLDIPQQWCIVASPLGYHFYPSQLRGEGLFMSVLRLSADAPTHPQRPQRVRLPKPHPLQSWLRPDSQLVVEDVADQVAAVPEKYYGDIAQYKKALNIVTAGVPMAQKKGRDYLPTQHLAMSTALNLDAFPQADVDTALALSYLRREAITLPSETPRGIVLLTYQCQPLGWVKNLGNRANNLYPDPWRIRH